MFVPNEAEIGDGDGQVEELADSSNSNSVLPSTDADNTQTGTSECVNDTKDNQTYTEVQEGSTDNGEKQSVNGNNSIDTNKQGGTVEDDRKEAEEEYKWPR